MLHPKVQLWYCHVVCHIGYDVYTTNAVLLFPLLSYNLLKMIPLPIKSNTARELEYRKQLSSNTI